MRLSRLGVTRVRCLQQPMTSKKIYMILCPSYLGVIHLVRNPRSFVASAKRNRLPIEKSARQWTRFHKAIPLAAKWAGERLFQIRYDDFCADPNVELSRLRSWMEPPPTKRWFQPQLTTLQWRQHCVRAGSCSSSRPSRREYRRRDMRRQKAGKQSARRSAGARHS